MLADPQTVTINAIAQVLPRISQNPTGSVYRKDDGTVKFILSNTEGKRYRHNVRLDVQKVAVDPLTAENFTASMSAYLVIDRPVSGYTLAEARDVVIGLTAWLTSANVLKVLGFEN